MNRQEIEQKVNDILVDTLYVEPDEVKGEVKIYDDLRADSLDCVEIIMALEKSFCISIKDDEAMKCETVKEIYDLVENLL